MSRPQVLGCLSLLLLALPAAHGLVWSLVLGHPVIDAHEPSSPSPSSAVDVDGHRAEPEDTPPELRPDRRPTASRPTRHHHGQDKCGEDRQCGKGRFCDLHYGVCRPEKSPGFACRRDRMCAKGLHCMYGRCQAKIAAGEEGSRCHGGGDCQPGLCCARRHGESVCQRRLTVGQRCYVPDGGLEYSLNQLCPCHQGLVCTQTSPSESQGTFAGGATTDSETFPFWTSTDNLRCQPVDPETNNQAA